MDTLKRLYDRTGVTLITLLIRHGD